jgi:tRNA modification GTPase
MLVGPVNVGKSTLFNKMIDKDRAIVTNIKGTTRDILSNEFIFNSNQFEVFDTAGQRSKQGKIEKYGYKKAQNISRDIDHFFVLIDQNTKRSDISAILKDFLINKNYSLIETKSDIYAYKSKNIKINYSFERDKLFQKLKLSSIHSKYVKNKQKKTDFNLEEMDFLERILEYEGDIVKEKDILIIAQLIRNILDDFSFEFGYINNEDVYDRVFSKFCIGK